MSIDLYRGDDFTRGYILKRKSNSAVIDLTGSSAILSIRDEKNLLVHVANSLVSGEIVITGGLNSRIDIHIPALITAGWLPKNYKYNFKIIDAAGFVKTCESNSLTVM